MWEGAPTKHKQIPRGLEDWVMGTWGQSETDGCGVGVRGECSELLAAPLPHGLKLPLSTHSPISFLQRLPALPSGGKRV